jgi:hypothetical protein
MSTVIALVTKVHERQVEAANKGQHAVLGLLGRASEILDKAPRPPERVQTGLKPLASLVGSPSDYVRYATASSKDWTQARESFQSGLLDLFTPAPAASTSNTTQKSQKSSSKGSRSATD